MTDDMAISAVMQEACKIGDNELFHFGDDYEAAEKCKKALEEANPGKAYVINNAVHGGLLVGCTGESTAIPEDFFVEEGLIEGCVDGKGGDFDSWSTYINVGNAMECLKGLQRIEAGKENGRVCIAENLGGIFVDNWRVTCGSK